MASGSSSLDLLDLKIVLKRPRTRLGVPELRHNFSAHHELEEGFRVDERPVSWSESRKCLHVTLFT